MVDDKVPAKEAAVRRMSIGDTLPAAEAIHCNGGLLLLEDITRRGFGGAAKEIADLAARIEIGLWCTLACGATCDGDAMSTLPLIFPDSTVLQMEIHAGLCCRLIVFPVLCELVQNAARQFGVCCRERKGDA